MKKYGFSFLFFAVLFLPLSAQSQEDRDAPKREVFVILDVSGSMIREQKFANVREYLNRDVIGDLLQEGDTFTLITFGDTAEERFSFQIASDDDRNVLRAGISALQPDNNYTDIGVAMEKLAQVLETRKEPGVRRLILFITDGLNAPPPESLYRGKDLSVDERFRTAGEKISKGGWFLYVIGIGDKTDAETIARAVTGSVVQVTGSGLDGVDAASYAAQVEEKALALEQADAEIEQAEDGTTGTFGFTGDGFLLLLFLGLLGLLGILIILTALVRGKIFSTIEVVISDGQETLSRKLAPFKGIVLNSPEGALPAISGVQTLCILRGAFGLKVDIIKGGNIADGSPYKKPGVYPLKGAVDLANGKSIRAQMR